MVCKLCTESSEGKLVSKYYKNGDFIICEKCFKSHFIPVVRSRIKTKLKDFKLKNNKSFDDMVYNLYTDQYHISIPLDINKNNIDTVTDSDIDKSIMDSFE